MRRKAEDTSRRPRTSGEHGRRTGQARRGTASPSQEHHTAPVTGQPSLDSRGLLSLYRPDLAETLATKEVPSYRYTQVCEHLFRRPLRSLAESTVLPVELRDALSARTASTLTEIEAATSPDGTTKLLLGVDDKSRIETVIMRYTERATVCVSSQAGCPVGCRFCATGAMGFQRNLTAAEIVDQVRVAGALLTKEGLRVSNIVYMGMGEPLLNARPVLDSVRILTHPKGQALAHRSLSISTVGIPRAIVRLAQAEPQVNLALSLHAPDDRTRALLVPDNHRHTVSEVLEAAWQHFDLTHRKLLVEYVLLDRINDSTEQARKLAALLRGHVVAVNLMNWNETSFEGKRSPSSPIRPPAGARSSSALASPFRPAQPAAAAAFKQTLRAAHIECVVRESRGAGVGAACGQLAGQTAGSGS